MKLLGGFLDEYNGAHRRLPLVFFWDAIQHVARITRVLAQPRGSLLLVGVGGSGKQSLCRLASFIVDRPCAQPEARRGYVRAEWHDELRALFTRCGVEGQHVTLLLTDAQVNDDEQLEDLNGVLSCGDVPGLLSADDVEKVVADVRPLAEACCVSLICARMRCTYGGTGGGP